MNTSSIFEKIATGIEVELQNYDDNFNVNLVDWSDSHLEFSFKIKNNTNGILSGIRDDFYYRSSDWANVGMIDSLSDFLSYIRENKIVEKWNREIEENYAYAHQAELLSEAKSMISGRDGYHDDIESFIEEFNETVDVDDQVNVDEILDTVSDIEVSVYYVGTDFWTEEILVEEWEFID